MQIATMQKVVPIDRKPKVKKPEISPKATQKEVAEYIGRSVSWVSRRGKRAYDPLPYYKVDGSLYYEWQEVIDWVDRNTVRNGAQA
ncbi:hypothetical protein [Enterococcus asini]|uniref:hypothetical protein n=1 Tax=Enterococcus asini TaxID=57732 RepID=UPI00241EE2E5|nr:hypothetical protein [Enterococcus asini]